MRRMGTAAAIAAMVCAFALVGTASGAEATNFRLTVTVPAEPRSGAGASGFIGTAVMNVPHVGHATVFWRVTLFAVAPDLSEVHHSFSMFIEATNGDVLQLTSGNLPGSNPSLEMTGPWFVSSGTGRFESLTGSGTFSAVTTGSFPDFTETISLVGSLQRTG